VIGPLTDPVVHGATQKTHFMSLFPAFPVTVFAAAGRNWLVRRAHRDRMDRADAPPRLRPLRRLGFIGKVIAISARQRGGHFAAFEQPAIFVDEIRNAFPSRRP